MAEVKNVDNFAKNFTKLNDIWSDEVKLEQWGVDEADEGHKQRVLEQKQFTGVTIARLAFDFC